MIPRKFLGLPDLTRAQALCVYKPLEVIMIGEDKDLMFAAF